MKLTLNKDQLNFLFKEFNLTEEDIKTMNAEQWKNIREKSFMIEAEEVPEDDSNINERCKIATSIADTKYNDLFTN